MRKGLLAGTALAATLATGATALLPARVEEASRMVEAVRGRRFERVVPASEMGQAELRRVLQAKIAEAFPAPVEDVMRALTALGLVEESPNLVDRLLDFYVSQVVAFYDPEPRRFFVIRGAENAFEGAGMEELADRLILSHELTHALQDESLRLDRRLKELRDNTDRTLALECLLEGEATLVMVRVALNDIPGASEEAEEMLAPLLSAGALEKANVPKDIPEYFVEQLFFPYTEGTAYVRRAVAKGGWAEVDRLWRSPPLSTSEILHEGPPIAPATNLLPAATASLAPAGLRPLFSDTLGEWTIRFLLRRTLPDEDADAAAEGWRGDRIAFFSTAGGPRNAFLWRIRFDSPGSAARFETAWGRLKRRRPTEETIARSGREILVTHGYAKVPDLPGFPRRVPAVASAR
jgi:hypothetical protein